MARTMYPTQFQLTAPRARQQLSNTFSGSAGEMGVGDRGGWDNVPTFTANPHDSNDYVHRWRQYVHLYEISWEARKIIRIPVEDALRKPWVAEDLPSEVVKAIEAKLSQINFQSVLSRSLMLERLLGGCLTFVGLDDKEDDPSKPYHPKQGAAVRFMNSIPVSRINRIEWDTHPLSENYMRPSKYMINGQTVHVSRCLVWDGDPLFDPYDFALTNFRSNLAGFGPSKLAPIWDDIVKAVGTRQAAYQMIKTNNSLVMAVNGLQDLMGAGVGQSNISKLKEIANSLSLYRAALVDAEQIKEMDFKAASFGSVPELLITYLQVLSAASDIPATRFLGQAPGGLNATGESDLENYYNMLDALQRQRIEPKVRRIYDMVGFSLYKEKWHQYREQLTFKFPPLWNETEKESSERATLVIDNVLKVLDRGLITEEKAIDEINMKEALSVQLDKDDLELLEDIGEGGETPKKDSLVPRVENSVTRELIKKAGHDPESVNEAEFRKGMKVEMEHKDVTGGEPLSTAKIALAHLAEDPQYYTKLEKVENAGGPANIVKTTALTQKLNKLLSEMAKMEYGPAWSRKNNQAKAEYDRTRLQQRTGMDFHGYHDVWASHNQLSNSKQPTWCPNPQQGEVEPFDLHGLKMSIENPKGSMRSGKNKDGTEWSSILPAHYGYIKKTEGADGDEVDAYVGPHQDSELVFVVDQLDADTKEFDEHKVIFGALGMTQAKELYLAGFSDGKAESRLGAITPMHVDQFKQWIGEGDTKAPFSKNMK